MSQFPIAEYLHKGLTPRLPSWWPLDPAKDLASAVDWRTGVGEAVLFDFSVAAELFWDRPSESLCITDLGPMKMPFPAIWSEWGLPKGAGRYAEQNGVPVDGVVGLRQAAYLREYPLADGRTELAIIEFIWPEGVSPKPYISPVGWSMTLDEQGVYVPDSIQRTGQQEGMNLMSREHLEMVIKANDATPLMALNLINCRNVSTGQGGVAYGRSGREKRQGVPVTRFHTIKLPGMTHRPGKGGRRSARDEAVMAQHRVRGHFKTYTAEAPLLGKHVGTYWWGWQVRGSSARGEVVSDYSLG